MCDERIKRTADKKLLYNNKFVHLLTLHNLAQCKKYFYIFFTRSTHHLCKKISHGCFFCTTRMPFTILR